MEMALYEPGLGYYSAGARKFGPEGDFITAPEISPLFSACVARQCEQVFELTGLRTILELGAGSGVMASDILSDLENRSNLPDEYLILETSAELRWRQQQRLQQDHPDFFPNIRWLDSLPSTGIGGVVVANEVLDAIPVNRIRLTDGEMKELKVGFDGERFLWRAGDVSDIIRNELDIRLKDIVSGLPDGYETEVNTLVPAYVRSLSDVLATGAILLIDYGYPRSEYYHPQRIRGTLACHYRHRSHEDPFILVGIQDITAFVDFTTVAECGHEAGLDVKGYSTQAGFLMSMGLEDVIQEYKKDGNELKLSQQAGRLLLPGGMGESFKVMALTRNVTASLDGFRMLNRTDRL
jgi:SAM-dependent MidA family methyltransferase